MLNNLYFNLYLKAFIIAYIGIPSSSLMELKVIMFILLVYNFMLWCIIDKKVNIKWNIIIFLIPTFILGSAFLQSVIYGKYIEEGLRFFLNTYVILISVLIYYIAIINKLISFNDVKNSFYIGAIVFSFIKLFIMYTIIFEDIHVVRPFINEIVYGNYGGLLRLNLGNDSIITFAFLALLPFLKGFEMLIALIIILFILLTSYTKYLLLTVLVSVFILGTLYNKRLTIIFISVSFLPFLLFDIDNVIEIYTSRFFEYSSYEDKILQIKIFVTLILNSIDTFLLGRGLGAYIEWFIKNPRLPFVYEVQWLGVIYQLGILRSAVIACILYILLYKIYKLHFFNKYLTINFMLWLLASFTNPYLLIVPSFIIYTIYISMIYRYENSYTRYKGYS